MSIFGGLEAFVKAFHVYIFAILACLDTISMLHSGSVVAKRTGTYLIKLGLPD